MLTSSLAGLAAFLSPTESARFLSESWPHRPFVLHGQSERLREIMQLPLLSSLDALLTSWPSTVSAHLPDLRDEASSIEITPLQAKKCFENKMALLFNEVQKGSPLLNEYLLGIKQELGMPAMTHARCMVYATPDGKGTAPHFDQNINFVLQLSGTKKWQLAPNPQVSSPSQRHTLGTQPDPELKSYLDQPLPESFPQNGKEFVLDPGSILFIPQGYYHQTSAQGSALALNFTYSQPSYVDLFTAALRSRLLLSPEWREYADGAGFTDPSLREFPEEKLNLLLQELIEDVPHWKAQGILGATEGHS